MTQIKSKIHTYGNPHESSWPSQYGTGEKGFFHVDKETGSIEEGFPENPNPCFGTPPTVIFDSMPPTYHEKACRIVESRKEWEMLDKQHGTITFGSKKDATPRVDEFNEKKKLKQQRRKASFTALQAYRQNPREVEQRLEKQAEQQIETLKRSGINLDKALKEHK